jgi:hypothetical protein
MKNNRTKKIGRRGKILLATFIAIMLVGVASAGYLTYFGKVTTTMTVDQSVVIGDGTVWHNWNEPISRDLGNVVHCTDYTYKMWIWNRACVAADATFTDYPDPEGTGITISHYIFGDEQTIGLRQKNAEWEVINEAEIGANITFNTCGTTFDYSINYWGIDGDYSLIYYLDHYFVADWNAGPDADYGVEPDCYEHIRGAKLWIVPTSNLVDSAPLQETILNAWTPSAYLFETDLALYIDCDDLTPPHLAYVYPLFDTNILQPETVYCWISCYHAAFDITPGNYAFDTFLTAVTAT